MNYVTHVSFYKKNIGHEEVSHAHIDIILSSHRGIPEENQCDGIPVRCDVDSEGEDLPTTSEENEATPCKRSKSESKSIVFILKKQKKNSKQNSRDRNFQFDNSQLIASTKKMNLQFPKTTRNFKIKAIFIFRFM